MTEHIYRHIGWWSNSKFVESDRIVSSGCYGNSCNQGRNEGGAIPWVTMGGGKKSQQCHKYFLQYSLLPKIPRCEYGGAKLASCPGRHLTSLRPWLLWPVLLRPRNKYDCWS